MAMDRFAYTSAANAQEVIAVLDETCRPLAGGTDLLAMMKEGLTAPDRLVDIKSISSLRDVREAADGVHIGALVTLSELLAHPVLQRPEWQVLYEAIYRTASPQLRHMATIGGNLLQRPRCWYFRNKLTYCLRKGGKRCFAAVGRNKYHAILGGGPCWIVHPSDPAVALLALDAEVSIAGSGGQRSLPLRDLYLLPKQDPHNEADIAADELLTELYLPLPAPTARGLYRKVAERAAWDFAVVSVAVQLAFSGDKVEKARIVLGGVSPIPWRAGACEEVLAGQQLTDEVIAETGAKATEGARSLADNGYKIPLVQGLVRQALEVLR